MEPNKEEQFLSKDETLKWLEQWLNQMAIIPKDLEQQPSLASAAKHLLDTACDIEIKPGFHLQWFAIRLDPDSL